MSKIRNMKMVRSRLGLALLATVAAVVVIRGVSYASIPSGGGVINGCYQKSATANGTHPLSVINTAVTSKCPSGFRTLNWDANGASGYIGQDSDLQLMDTMTYVTDVSLPAGSYVINASVWLQNTSPSNSSSLGVCELVYGSTNDQVEAGLLGPSSSPLNNQTLSMTLAANNGDTDATLYCEAVGNTGETNVETADVAATEVGNVAP
jgi:hypothetical protein